LNKALISTHIVIWNRLVPVSNIHCTNIDQSRFGFLQCLDSIENLHSSFIIDSFCSLFCFLTVLAWLSTCTRTPIDEIWLEFLEYRGEVGDRGGFNIEDVRVSNIIALGADDGGYGVLGR
jgi:hypothetical protein